MDKILQRTKAEH